MPPGSVLNIAGKPVNKTKVLPSGRPYSGGSEGTTAKYPHRQVGSSIGKALKQGGTAYLG